MSGIPKNLKEIVKDEYAKCAKNPAYFMKRYAKIQHPTRGKMLFELYPFQEDVLHEFNEHRYNIVLKSRQLGISTLIAGYSLWMMLFNNDKNILVIATKQDTAKNLVTKVRVMYDNLPSWLKTGVQEDNKLSLRFNNGSQIKAASAASDSGRSEALSLLVIDEAAFIDEIEPIWASAQQTLSTGGSAIINSTPNGVGNFYHKKWVDAKLGHGGFNPIELLWQLHPERDQEWRDEQDILLGPNMAKQECDGNFLASGRAVVDGELVQWYEQTHAMDPLEKRGGEEALWIWKYPDPTRDYIVVADVARGDGNDNSAFHVIDVESLEQVAEYTGKLDTKSYGNTLVSIATEYNDALLVVENANVGWAAIQQIIDRNYGNLYYTYREDGYVDPSVQLPKGYDLKTKQNMVPGFTTSSKTRPLLISKLETYFRERGPIIRSRRLIEELYVFIWNGAKAEAQRGYNDDLVMSFAIGLWVRDTAMKLRKEGIEQTRLSLNYINKSATPHKTSYSFNDNNNGWSMKVNNTDEDLTWLIK